MGTIGLVLDWIGQLQGWLQTGDRGNMIYAALAICLLVELSIRVALRLLFDARVRLAVASNSLRIDARLRRGPMKHG
jgi:hypothetical protein